MEPDVSRLLALVVSTLLLILCVALPSITHADSGDEAAITPTRELSADGSPTTLPSSTAELSSTVALPTPTTTGGTSPEPESDRAAISREATSASPAQVEPAALPYRASLPLVLGGGSAVNAVAPTFEDQVVQLINLQRAQAGCPALQVVPELSLAARQHSEDMATNDFFSHTGSDGSRPWDRMQQAGYNWSTAAENIAGAAGTPADVVALWMNSPSHRANILDCGLRDTGLGFAQLVNDTGSVNYHTYWTEVFGSR
jgi:uncharacterized protein YkwD